MFGFSLHFKIPFTESFLKIEAKEERPNRPTPKAANPMLEIGPPPAFLAEKAVTDAGGHVMENENPWHAVLRMLNHVGFRMNQIRKSMIAVASNEPTHEAAIRFIKAWREKCNAVREIRDALMNSGFELISEESTESAVMRLIGDWKKQKEDVRDQSHHLKELVKDFGVLPSDTWTEAIGKVRKLLAEKSRLEVLPHTRSHRLDLFCEMLNRHGIDTPDQSLSGVCAAVEEWITRPSINFDQYLEYFVRGLSDSGFEQTEEESREGREGMIRTIARGIAALGLKNER